MRDAELQLMIRGAIKNGQLSELAHLIHDDRERLRMQTPFGTWLHVAAAHGKAEIVRWLVSQGAELDSVGGMGDRRPIDEAAANGHVSVVRFLIEAGAILDTSSSSLNPLIATIVGGNSDSHTAVARLLLESGIDPSVRYPNLDNMRAIEYAREWGRTDIAKLLAAHLSE